MFVKSKISTSLFNIGDVIEISEIEFSYSIQKYYEDRTFYTLISSGISNITKKVKSIVFKLKDGTTFSDSDLIKELGFISYQKIFTKIQKK
jgi:hypothetical protein